MNSKRLLALAEMIDLNDVVLDVGCDHGYLSIYLKQNKLCQEVYASDVNINALNMAKENIKKAKVKIKTFLSDGFNNIDVYFDTAVIAGMGSHTILKILNSEKSPSKLIICSNNAHEFLRKNLNIMGYKIIEEKVIYENKHYYIIMKWIKGQQNLSKKVLLFGISNNKEYYQHLLTKNNELLSKVPLLKKINLLYENHLLKGLIEKK